MSLAHVARVVSGGQTGVDRAALDFAIAHGIPYGGWCPRGGWAEDHPNPPGLLALYPELRETPSDDPAQRTEWNVRDSDACLIVIAAAAESPGTDRAAAAAEALRRPAITVDPGSDAAAEEVGAWIRSFPEPITLSVGGPRESESRGIYAATLALLERVRTA